MHQDQVQPGLRVSEILGTAMRLTQMRVSTRDKFSVFIAEDTMTAPRAIHQLISPQCAPAIATHSSNTSSN